MKQLCIILFLAFLAPPYLHSAGIAGYEFWYDNAFDARTWVTVSGNPATYTVNQVFDADGLSPGLHFFHIRFKDSDGRWSTVRSTSFLSQVTTPWSNTSNTLSGYEYWIDDRFDTRTTSSVSAATATFSAELDYSSLNPGLHFFHVRFRDGENRWSTVRSSAFIVLGPALWSDAANTVTAYEYWLDDHFDQRVTASASTPVFTLNTDIDYAALSSGLHFFHIRFKDAAGRWSTVRSRDFFIPPLLPDLAGNLIAGYRFWFDDGSANPTVVTLPTPVTPLTLNTAIDVPNYALNTVHDFFIQFVDTKGQWSTVLSSRFLVQNHAPVALCQSVSLQLPATGCSTPAVVDNGSYDQDGDDITLTQSPPGPYPVGVTQVTLTVTDALAASSTCAATVTVTDATPPVPVTSTLPTITGACFAEITTAPHATDNCAGDVIGTTSAPWTFSTQGTHAVTWTFSDGNGNTSQQTQYVEVIDVAPPVLILGSATMYLWSPNHQYETITLGQMVTSVTDNCGGVPAVSIVQVTSDEPDDAVGNGDGSTLNDIVIGANCASVQVRSERDGTGDGRVYRIHLRAVDANGNSAISSYTVAVQHNNNTPAVEGVAVYTVTGNCSTPKAAAPDVAGERGVQLDPNYPNPFNPKTTISFSLPDAGHVALRVMDALGRVVAVLADDVLAAGSHVRTFDAHALTSGTYLCRLEVGDQVRTRVMHLVK